MEAINCGPNLFFQSFYCLLLIISQCSFLIYLLCSFETIAMPFNFQSTLFRAKMQYNRPCKYSRPCNPPPPLRLTQSLILKFLQPPIIKYSEDSIPPICKWGRVQTMLLQTDEAFTMKEYKHKHTHKHKHTQVTNKETWFPKTDLH